MKTWFKYILPNEEDRKLDMVLTSAGHMNYLQDSEFPVKGHPQKYTLKIKNGRILDEFQLIYIARGKGTYYQEKDKGIPVSQGTIITLMPGIWHNFYPDKKIGWESYYFGFSGQYFINLVEMGFFNDFTPLINLGNNEQIFHIFLRIIELAKSEPIEFQIITCGLIINLLGHLRQRSFKKRIRKNEIPEQINKAKLIFLQSIENTINIEDVAYTLNMGYSSFRKLFKKYTGYSPGMYLISLRIQRAKELLYDERLLIKEIAYKLDFSSENYFIHSFKAKTGYSPGEYRKRINDNSK